jgi:protein-S-isoprenylcysteine O-methyltransferase Ste14
METLWIALRTSVYVVLFLGFWLWLAGLLQPLDARIGVSLPAWTQGLGLVTLLAGAALMFWCIAMFVVRGRGTPALFDSPRRLVIRGPYRLVRNPMYVGLLTLLAGLALRERSVAVLALLAIAFTFVNVVVRLHEEPRLRRLFDGEYEDYCRSVPRWIPRVGAS